MNVWLFESLHLKIDCCYNTELERMKCQNSFIHAYCAPFSFVFFPTYICLHFATIKNMLNLLLAVPDCSVPMDNAEENLKTLMMIPRQVLQL